MSHSADKRSELRAGSAAEDISPRDSQFLFGYPHVERHSTGVHDPLLSSALYLGDGRQEMLLVANDIIFVPKAMAGQARVRIEAATGIPASHIMLTATHTHSGPSTVDYLSCEADPVVPKADAGYLRLMEDGIVAAGERAYRSARPAQAGLSLADGSGVGTNRRDPAGPADPQVPVLLARPAEGGAPLAVMAVCSMHPTVLHEDSTLVSGDFLGAARLYLQRTLAGAGCPVLFHTGPCGNQSPRHVVKANTFAEAERLGNHLGQAIERAGRQTRFLSQASLACRQGFVDLPRKTFLSVEAARAKLSAATERLAKLRRDRAPWATVRTAECDFFGAEESVTLAQAQRDLRLAKVYEACLPAEMQAFTVGPWTFVGWPGEVFVEYALAVKARRANTFVISLANGELQGYVVTPEAAAEGGYEASNGLFPPEAGRVLVQRTLELLA